MPPPRVSPPTRPPPSNAPNTASAAKAELENVRAELANTQAQLDAAKAELDRVRPFVKFMEENYRNAGAPSAGSSPPAAVPATNKGAAAPDAVEVAVPCELWDRFAVGVKVARSEGPPYWFPVVDLDPDTDYAYVKPSGQRGAKQKVEEKTAKVFHFAFLDEATYATLGSQNRGGGSLPTHENLVKNPFIAKVLDLVRDCSIKDAFRTWSDDQDNTGAYPDTYANLAAELTAAVKEDDASPTALIKKLEEILAFDEDDEEGEEEEAEEAEEGEEVQDSDESEEDGTPPSAITTNKRAGGAVVSKVAAKKLCA